MERIPRKLHFIWVGGDMPERNRTCVTSFVERNPGWEINLWIDRRNLLAGARRAAVMPMYRGGDGKATGVWDPTVVPSGDIETIAAGIGGSAGELRDLRQRNLASLINFARGSGIRLRYANEVSETGVAFLFSQYKREMTDRGTNFGAASDILRILILRREGGVYLDTDVGCRQPLPELRCMRHGALWGLVMPPAVNPPSEAEWHSVDWWTDTYGDGGLPAICNSTIACLPGSGALETYREIVRRNYQNIFSDAEAVDRYYRMSGIRSSTIQTTGPSAATEAARWDETRRAVATSGSALGQDELLKKGDKFKGVFHKRTWRTDRELRRRGEYWGRRWHAMKDEYLFPAYLIEDNFFHDWL